jgi:hypothetical protein
MATIDFTGRGVPEIPAFSTTPVSVSRFLDDIPSASSAMGGLRDSAASAASGLADRGMAAAEGLADRGVAAAQDAAQQGLDAAASALGGQDPDEIYEKVLERLRRDLVVELEQNGHLIRDHP